MAESFIALGSNIGDRQAHLKAACDALRQLPQTSLLQTSSWIETDPVGGPAQGKFLNGVVRLKTDLTPLALLEQLQAVEVMLGRPTQRKTWGPRTIDLDLIDYDAQLFESPKLTLPHARMHERSFVLLPMREVAPHWKHPRLNQTVDQLIEGLSA